MRACELLICMLMLLMFALLFYVVLVKLGVIPNFIADFFDVMKELIL